MRRRGERGETLAEVLVSTTLLGIIGIGIIGAIASVLISTDIDRRVSAGETVLRSYVAAIEAARYQDCAGTGSYKPSDVGFVEPLAMCADPSGQNSSVPVAEKVTFGSRYRSGPSLFGRVSGFRSLSAGNG